MRLKGRGEGELKLKSTRPLFFSASSSTKKTCLPFFPKPSLAHRREPEYRFTLHSHFRQARANEALPRRARRDGSSPLDASLQTCIPSRATERLEKSRFFLTCLSFEQSGGHIVSISTISTCRSSRVDARPATTFAISKQVDNAVSMDERISISLQYCSSRLAISAPQRNRNS